MGDGDDGTEFFQLYEQFFDFGGADGIEGRARLVEQEHFRFDGEGAGNAQALLLAAGKLVSGFMKMVFHFVPERGMPKAFFDGLGQGELRAIDAQTRGDVVEDGFGKWIGPLEDHADATAEQGNVLRKKALAIEEDFSLEAGDAQRLRHAVHGAKERGSAEDV